MIIDILKAIHDSTQPTNRVFRKATAISIGLVGLIIYYRHVVLGFGLGEAMLVTAMLAFLALTIIGVFGGMMAAGFYDSFLRAVGATEKQLSIVVFFAEWLFASTAPLLGILLYVFLGSRDVTY